MKNTEMAEQEQPMITAEMFAARYRSKKECYNFLACKCGAYLPASTDCLTVYHLRDCATGVKKCKSRFHLTSLV